MYYGSDENGDEMVKLLWSANCRRISHEKSVTSQQTTHTHTHNTAL